MAEYFHLYVKQECPFCDDAVSMLKEKNKEYVITMTDGAPQILEAYKNKYNHPTVPIVVRCEKLEADGILIGGYTELKEYLND